MTGGHATRKERNRWAKLDHALFTLHQLADAAARRSHGPCGECLYWERDYGLHSNGMGRCGHATTPMLTTENAGTQCPSWFRRRWRWGRA